MSVRLGPGPQWGHHDCGLGSVLWSPTDRTFHELGNPWVLRSCSRGSGLPVLVSSGHQPTTAPPPSASSGTQALMCDVALRGWVGQPTGRGTCQSDRGVRVGSTARPIPHRGGCAQHCTGPCASEQPELQHNLSGRETTWPPCAARVASGLWAQEPGRLRPLPLRSQKQTLSRPQSGCAGGDTVGTQALVSPRAGLGQRVPPGGCRLQSGDGSCPSMLPSGMGSGAWQCPAFFPGGG